MKYFILALLCIGTIASCKKDEYAAPTSSTNFPLANGMRGVVGADSFIATSGNGTLTYYPKKNMYELNISTGVHTTEQIINLRYSLPNLNAGSYLLQPTGKPDIGKTWAYFKDNDTTYYGDGYIYIHSIVDSIVKGAYDFKIQNNRQVKGTFHMKVYYDTDSTR